jgi:hypothetical protein
MRNIDLALRRHIQLLLPLHGSAEDFPFPRTKTLEGLRRAPLTLELRGCGFGGDW